MKAGIQRKKGRLWFGHDIDWRSPAQTAVFWKDAGDVDPALLQYRTTGQWWNILEAKSITLLATREYEHIIMGISVSDSRPFVTYMRMPHPSGLAVDRKRGIVYAASTRNPNQIYDLMPAAGLLPRLDMKIRPLQHRPLMPVSTRFYPGCLYIHDLALIGDALYANASGSNSVVRLYNNGQYKTAWWPRCIDGAHTPLFERNHIQLNSIAAGSDIRNSFFSASTDNISARKPGHKNFPVTGQGVILSGKTREAIARGLTRPHSARLYNKKLWVLNSGYGEFGIIDNGSFLPVRKMQGWTRGMCFLDNIAFVGISRVLPRFEKYAPGLEISKSSCGIYAIDITDGKILGSMIWNNGNQIFAVDWLPNSLADGFVFRAGARSGHSQEKQIFYAFKT